jgi:hypothetical protein
LAKGTFFDPHPLFLENSSTILEYMVQERSMELIWLDLPLHLLRHCF